MQGIENYQLTESSTQTSDGLRYHYRVYKPKSGKANKVLVIHHGFGEHGGRYDNIIGALDGSGFIIYVPDARGHGKSEGKRGHAPSFEVYAEDLDRLVDIAIQENSSGKIYLLGHSMGALVVVTYAKKPSRHEKLIALVSSAIPLRVKTDTAMEVKKFFSGFLSSLAPSLTLPAGLDVNLLSHDKSVVDAYVKDPLVHGDISTTIGSFMLGAEVNVLPGADSISVPTLIFHGEEDGIASKDGSELLFDKISSKDKTIKIFPGLYHETMNELPAKKEEVLKLVTDWLNKH
ncbi:alpha/beta hydrolase [Leptospira sp. GIMC2001]|uniref:alpha/beta hydrolase n=1 Tax=Leptospira sp. GIMC2001 TaxID=1513297 RepID=UPI00234B0AB0|nr:alpha/beta hydrolase [Leptospira sp. GIMC2001]WCL48589.1 lysophospholipase [Leptospira sp. GIMC2001]